MARKKVGNHYPHDRRCCPQCEKPLKVQRWGKNGHSMDYKWNCLTEGCEFWEISPWVGHGEPVGLE